MPESQGGTQLHCYYLANELSRNYQIEIFCRGADSAREDYELLSSEYKGLKVNRINYLARDFDSFTKVYINPKIDKEFSKYLDFYKPDLVHIHHLAYLSSTIVKLIKDRGLPLVMTLHDYSAICPRGQMIRDDLTLCEVVRREDCIKCLKPQWQGVRRLNPKTLRGLFSPYTGQRLLKEFEGRMEEMLRLIDVLITPSDFLRNRFLEYSVPSDKIITVAHGLPLELFSEIERKQSTLIRFGYLGSLIPSKGVHILIEAFNRLEPGKASLEIWGGEARFHREKNYIEKLKRLAKSKDIYFRGSYDNEDIGFILSKIDILVIPSLWPETFSLTLREALAAKTPVIISAIGALPEIVMDGKNGMHFNPGDVDDLYSKLNWLLNNPAAIIEFKKNIEPIKSIKINSQEIIEIYFRLLTG
ncbi:MAG: glycosyltransferase [Deltaproteobacteria bacterium]|nr:MAG: glycosyltransferase [Deltaproteobacteria bacterium]